ncbi:MAG: DNA-binding protein WhiA [Acutalibacteraceae bacterium]|nr:DNA-binding protein WhiA [Acutalibacteraceae bacterium]
MSFSSETKKELCKNTPKLYEFMRAETYGLLLFCKHFNDSEISFTTESRDTASRFADFITAQTSSVVEIQKQLAVRSTANTKYKVCVPNAAECKNIRELFGHDDSIPTLRINRANLGFEVCIPSFLRGAFLTCGSISAPETEYHLEFKVPHQTLSNDLQRLIIEATEYTAGKAIVPKITNRRGSCVVYLKNGDDISDFLTMIGAPNASMNIMQVKILKNAENRKNREINSRLANTDKTLSAAAKQIMAIKKLKEAGQFETLSAELKQTAEIREKYPLASLKELCEYFDTSVSKSSLSRRLSKLTEMADTYNVK